MNSVFSVLPHILHCTSFVLLLLVLVFSCLKLGSDASSNQCLDCRNENQVLDSELRFRWRSKALISNGILVGNRDMNVFVEGLLSYPFLFCHFTVICTLWFTSARNRLPEEGQKWGFLVWLLFSYCLCALLISVSKSTDASIVSLPLLDWHPLIARRIPILAGD
ncbi:uncharacterized protein LOC105168710 isoform X1 [Sesamum indicum]|uniref:Uncharacterized protein LOC105168710 isoform X1 n=1 Tax=Sesamum indicum TaxID=4182 RepID=A0A8M8V542_SESIN|nr:uncharacterized protein LOC105168710 isoform X1 [Sesamum indicum]